MMAKPEWLEDLTHQDWLLDGYPIRGERMLAMWDALDWSKAYMDNGPSPSGNPGPYWHVPLTFEDDYSVHRLYPKLQTKWLRVVRKALEERMTEGGRMSAVPWNIVIKVPAIDGKPGYEVKVTTEDEKLWHALANATRQGIMPDVRKATIEIEAQG